ncbi:phospholipase, patatin family [gut metagenome]|uniref:Phospholipase, patatin family n=1 Tax=gut metagenome TaxID=749906 RepID=J9GKE6_9ZZZZ
MSKNPVLLLEGGALRGVYTTGVLDVFMEHGLYLPQVVGVSAGALNALNYLSRQPGRGLEANVKYLRDPRYMGATHLFRDFSFFNFDFLLNEMPKELPFDYDTFNSTSQQLWAVATDCRTGKAQFYSNKALGQDFFTAIRASASIPLLSSMVRVGKDVCLDGCISLAVPLPRDLPFESGPAVLVLTRNKGYRKRPLLKSQQKLMFHRYAQHPQFLAACLSQWETYNRQMERIDALEDRGQIFVIRPKTPIHVPNTERDPHKLDTIYRQGYAEAEELFPALSEFLSKGGYSVK